MANKPRFRLDYFFWSVTPDDDTLIECKSGESYSKEDTKVFNKLKDSKYNISKNAIVCTTHVVYPIGEDSYALPISAI